MAYLGFPGKRLNLNALSRFVCFVLILCCQVSCVLVNVTREIRDVFAYPRIKIGGCSGLCMGKKGAVHKDLTPASCICKCSSNTRSFVIAEFKCVSDKVLRNATHLEFKLYDYELPGGHLKVISFNSHTTKIEFDVQDEYDENCTLNDIEELSYQFFKQWESVLDLLSYYIFENIEKKKTKNDDWMRLTLHWYVKPNRFVGRIMRLNVTCSDDGKKKKTGVMVFKVNGTVRVPDNPTSPTPIPVSTTYYLTPTPSTESSPLMYSTKSIMISPTMTSSSFQPVMSSSFEPMMSSSFEPMMSSSHKPMTSLSSLVPMTSSTLSSSTSSFNVFTESFIHSSITSSMLFSSSSVMVGPAMNSKSSNKAAVTGGAVAGIVVLLIIIVLLVYFLRKRRMNVLRRKHSDLSHINPSISSLTHLPAMNNPLSDGVYENPEVIDGTNRRSGVTSIESAAYEACLVVENPSARDVRSVYDNIPDPAEPTYKALDPAKREPSAKYQSLIKPKDHEYSTLADTLSGDPIQEPLYSEVCNGSSPEPVKNGGLNPPLPPPLTPRKPRSSVVAEPIYNELENSGNQTNNNNPAPLSRPQREPPNPTVAEPIYNELENSGSQAEESVKPEEDVSPTPSPQRPDSPTPAEPIYNELEGSGDQITEDERPNELANGLEESNESDGRNGPVYSVLEEE